MSFKGMDPDQGREVAQAIKTAGTQTAELFQTVSATVQGVDWVGPDAENFKSDWTSFVSGVVHTVEQLYNTKSQELEKNAEEQDDTSNQG